MHNFSCLTRDGHSPVPTLSFVIAESAERASELARRELLNDPSAVAVEIYLDNCLVCVIERDGPEPDGVTTPDR